MVGVLVAVNVGVTDGVTVGVLDGVAVGVTVGVFVMVAVGVTVAVLVAQGSTPETSFPHPSQSERSPKYGSETCAKAWAAISRLAITPIDTRNLSAKIFSCANFSDALSWEQTQRVGRSIE